MAYHGGPLNVELAGSETRNTPALSYKLFTNDVGLRVFEHVWVQCSAASTISRHRQPFTLGSNTTDQNHTLRFE